MVTVVDTGSMLEVVSSIESLKDSGLEAGPEDERTLCDLMVDQVRGALRADWDCDLVGTLNTELHLRPTALRPDGGPARVCKRDLDQQVRQSLGG